MNLKKELPLILLAIVPFVYLAVIWNHLPETVPLHWNAAGEIDRYGSRKELWMIPLMTSGLIYLLMLAVPAIDPKKRIQEMGAKYTQLRYALVAAMSALAVVIIYMVERGERGGLTPVLVITGLLIAVLGNYMKTVRPNYFIGIRTPWTLESPEVWNKTHSLAGKLWFAGGLVIVLLPFLVEGPLQFYLLIGLVLLISFIPVVYSYLQFRKQPG